MDKRQVSPFTLYPMVTELSQFNTVSNNNSNKCNNNNSKYNNKYNNSNNSNKYNNNYNNNNFNCSFWSAACPVVMDLAFLLDGSTSITSADFTRVKTFVKKTLLHFTISAKGQCIYTGDRAEKLTRQCPTDLLYKAFMWHLRTKGGCQSVLLHNFVKKKRFILSISLFLLNNN